LITLVSPLEPSLCPEHLLQTSISACQQLPVSPSSSTSTSNMLSVSPANFLLLISVLKALLPQTHVSQPFTIASSCLAPSSTSTSHRNRLILCSDLFSCFDLFAQFILNVPRQGWTASACTSFCSVSSLSTVLRGYFTPEFNCRIWGIIQLVCRPAL
jgi:hypothetical protein